MRPLLLLLVATLSLAMAACAPLRWIGKAITALGTPPAPSLKSAPKPFSGHLVAVDSATRLRVMTPKDLRTVKVELAGLRLADPALATQARQYLAQLCAHAPLRIRPLPAPKGAPLTAHVHAGDRWVNLAMVEAGLLQPLPGADPRLLKAAQDRLLAR